MDFKGLRIESIRDELVKIWQTQCAALQAVCVALPTTSVPAPLIPSGLRHLTAKPQSAWLFYSSPCGANHKHTARVPSSAKTLPHGGIQFSCHAAGSVQYFAKMAATLRAHRKRVWERRNRAWICLYHEQQWRQRLLNLFNVSAFFIWNC